MCMLDDWVWSDFYNIPEEEYPVKCIGCEYTCPTYSDCELCSASEEGVSDDQ